MTKLSRFSSLYFYDFWSSGWLTRFSSRTSLVFFPITEMTICTIDLRILQETEGSENFIRGPNWGKKKLHLIHTNI